jgi:hypothetical protein
MAFGGDALAQGAQGLARDHLAADRRLQHVRRVCDTVANILCRLTERPHGDD